MPYFNPNAPDAQYVVKSTYSEVRQEQWGRQDEFVWRPYHANHEEQVIHAPTFSQEGFDINSKAKEDPRQPQEDTYQRR